MYSQVLATAVRERRKQLCLSQQGLAARTQQLDPKHGISTKTVSDIELAKDGERRPMTLIVLDRALGWPETTCRHILDTGQAGLPSEEDDVRRRLDELEAAVRRIREVLSNV